MGELAKAVRERDEKRFARALGAVRDPFWEKHATLQSAPLAAPSRLIGVERVQDILVNVFWPFVALDDENAARAGLGKLTLSASGAARIATQRTLISALAPKQFREALVQQGLLQVFRDYCAVDCSQCRACTFPELVKAWKF